ncbi:MAG TPA: acyl-CoA dehydrogenase family protein [Mycobacteriales bacterium]|nr:acyl-CoA dehydrogenase family protein [Mycobacteriales bacterium]
MDLGFSETERALADEFREWLAASYVAPPQFASIDEEIAWGRTWQARMAADRWVGVDWPAEYGGRGASPLDVALVNLEYGRSGAPQLVNRVGLNLAGPTLLAWGTAEQKSRLLPGILHASEIWCQLFSEPEAGSDLGSLRTAAERVEGGWRLTGQKVWTSYAQYARWGICLARTPATDGRRSITYFVVDMTADGVRISPLRQITGEAEFNEVFLDGVFVPDSDVVGAVGDGWKVAGTTLAHERGTNFPLKEQTVQEGYFRALWQAADRDDVVVADELARVYVELRLLALSNLRMLSRLAAGEAPGPESSVTKLQWSTASQHLAALWLQLAPEDPAAQRQFLWSKAASIAGGTSEVQRTIIGERILALPR